MNAAEKAKMAREAQEREREKKKRKWKEGAGGRKWLAILVLIVVVGYASLVFQIIGFFVYNNLFLTLMKVGYYVGLALIFFSIIFTGATGMLKGIKLSYRGRAFENVLVILWIIATIALVIVSSLAHSSKIPYIKSFYVNEEYGVVYAEQDVEYVVWQVKGGHEYVLIETEVDGMKVSEIKESAAKNNNDMVTLVFESGDMKIQQEAFLHCTKLTEILFADNSAYTIGENSFSQCARLKTVDKGVDSTYSTKSNSFSDCPLLEYLDLN